MQPFTQHIEETWCKGNGDYAAYVLASILQQRLRPLRDKTRIQNTKHDSISIVHGIVCRRLRRSWR